MLLAINSADDERNPPELGVLEREITGEKRPRAANSQQRRDLRSRHHGASEILEERASRVAAKRAAQSAIELRSRSRNALVQAQVDSARLGQ